MMQLQLQQHHQEVEEEEEEEASNSSSHHHHHNKASPSPSFSSYSSETLAEIAARVIEELSRDPSSLPDDDDALFPPWENQNDSFVPQNDEPTEQNDDDDDFEFAFVSRDFASPVSADDIFSNGQIKPMYPIFGVVVPSNDAVSSVLPNNNNNNNNNNIATSTPRRRLPLRKLMFEEGETASCSSSTEESVDLEGVVAAEGAYCVWTPNSVGRERKKSNSTGSASKRWKLRVRDLLLRSHSDGKDNKQQQQKQQQKELKEVVFQIPKNKVAAKPQNGTEHAEQNKRKSFLPYRPELVGLFANVNGLGRNLRPF